MSVKHSPFRNEREALAHAANQVALSWLRSAEDILVSGRTPSKLSGPHGYQVAREEISRRLYDGYVLSAEQVHALAVRAAKIVLSQGFDYQRVRQHFSKQVFVGTASAAKPEAVGSFSQ